ncbi:MAG: tetratricopeptide repeat protein, partial [Bacteroidales bacterium]
NSVLQKQPSNMEAYLEIARIHQNRGFYDLAILGYNIVEKNKQYLKDDFDIIDLLFNRGLCNTKINLYDEAAADFQSVLKLGRDNLKCKSFYNLYVVYSSAQKYDLAISNFYKALDCAQELIIPSQWSSIGNIYLKLGQLDSAEAAINRAINRGDKGTTPYLYLTDLYLQKRDTIKAVEILKKAVAINSMDFDLWNQMGSLYFDLKNYTEAVKAYDSACRIEPENESANYNRCVCFLNLSVQYLAQNLFSECLETLVPASRCNKLKEKTDRIKFEAYAAIGLEQYNKGNFTAAIDTFKLALDIERNDWAVWYNLGLAYSMNKQNEEALISFTEAIKLGEDSKKAKSYLQRGGIYNNINKPLRAIEDFKQALSLPGTARLIGLTYISMGEDSLSGNKYFKAAALADSALKYEPENSSAYFLRGQATMLSGNTRKALLDFKKIQRDSALLYRVSCAKAQIFLDLGVQGFNHARYSAAEDTLKLALQEICICDDPQFKTKIHPKIWNMLGLVYSETLRYKEAVDAYTRAIELNPEYPQYRYYRGGAKYKMEQYVMARKDLQTAVKLDPQYADAHRMLLEVSFKLSDMDGACRECSELEKLKIDDLNYPCKKRILDQFGSQCPN